MSAIVEEDGTGMEPVKVLILLHEGFDLMDVCGPLEAFDHACHVKGNKDTKAFRIMLAAGSEFTESAQKIALRANASFEEAMKRLADIDVLVVPGGNTEALLKQKATQPIFFIKAFAELQKKNPSRERTLMSVCTGSFFLAEAGILAGLSATTHPDFIVKFENTCSNVVQRDMAERTDVVEQRYVVNNLRFELGENEDENPYIRRKSDGRRTSNARKGSMSWKEANTRRESILKRSALRLGGLRVVTTSGITSGIDGALYMVGALVSDDSAKEVARIMCYEWNKGMVVDGTDV